MSRVATPVGATIRSLRTLPLRSLSVRWSAIRDALPPVHQPIHQAITGDFGHHPGEKELIGDGQKNANRRHRRCWLKVVVGCLGGHVTLPPRAKGPTLTMALASNESRNTFSEASASSFLGAVYHIGT